jgi:hypothetical protein
MSGNVIRIEPLGKENYDRYMETSDGGSSRNERNVGICKWIY